MIEARRALLDVLEALGDQRESVILIGAQAIYLHTSSFDSSVAEYTKDADLALKLDGLANEPSIGFLLTQAGFSLTESNNPGQWLSASRTPVDIMVPKKLAGDHRRRADLPGHGDRTARSTHGIEGCLVDCELRLIETSDVSDTRSFEILVAGPASLLVAKAFKISERLSDDRLVQDKDAHDIYRLLAAVPLEVLVDGFEKLVCDPFSQDVTRNGLVYLQELFAAGAEAPGSMRAGRAEAPFGSAETVAQAVSALANDLLDELR